MDALFFIELSIIIFSNEAYSKRLFSVVMEGKWVAAEKYVFISYSSKDNEFVNMIVKILDQMGISYWRAPEMIPAGSNYAREIPKAILGCEVFLLVLSGTSQQSIWVEKEVDSAVRNRKVIIPVQIDYTPLSEMFLFYLNNVQMISYSENRDKAISDLKNQLQVIMSDREMPAKKSQSRQVEVGKVSSGNSYNVIITPERAKRKNAFSVNRIPTECRYCGGELTQVEIGTYRCVQCGRDNYDDFQTVRNYLEKNGATSSVIIERDTGVPRRIIDHFFKQEFLEIPKLSPVRLSCRQCGAPIRTGELCDNCKSGKKNDSADGKQAMRGTWHTKW